MTGNDEQSDAAEAWAVIQRDRVAVIERLSARSRAQSLIAVVMGAATASLAIGNTVVLTVATVVYIVGLLLVFGTPARVGMVPRDSRRSVAQVFLGAMALLGVFAVGLTGPQFGLWWLSVLAGVLVIVVVAGVVRWRRNALRRELLESVRG